MTRTQISTAGSVLKKPANASRKDEVTEMAKKFTMTLIDPATGRHTFGLGGKWSPPEIEAGSRIHKIAIS